MSDVLTLLATATDSRIARFMDMLSGREYIRERRKQTMLFSIDAERLPAVVEAAVGCAVTLQRVHEPGREETYETLHRGPMEGWASRVRA